MSPSDRPSDGTHPDGTHPDGTHPHGGSSARKDDRVTINKEFESYDAFINEYVSNISRTGVFVRSKTPLTIGTHVNLRFTVIMDDIETIEGVGEVVRVHEDPAGMGVVFTELSSYSKNLIDKLLTLQRGLLVPEK